MSRQLLTYIDIGGALTRRGVYVPPPPPDIMAQDFEGLTVANPISAADFRTAIQDPAFGDNPTQRALIQVVNVGGPEGKVLRVTLPASYYTGGNTGVAYASINLPRQATSFMQKTRMRFGTGFDTAKGGKAGFGIGGYTPTSNPVSDYTSPSNPPSGGNTTPYGWSARPEWGADGKIHELMYLPLRANYTPGSTVYGIGRSLSISAHVKGTFFDYERQITMNTAYETDTSIDPRDLTQGVDYLADGIHRVYVDGVLAYEKTNEVFQLYAPQTVKNMFSVFRGGGDSTWSASTAGSYFDFAETEVTEI